MLLTILLVADETSYPTAKTSIQSLESQFTSLNDWKGNYEILTITLSDKELMAASGSVSVINALLVQDGHLARCSGQYIWILPCFITVENNAAAFTMLFNSLSMGMTSVMLYSDSGNMPTMSLNVELVNSVIGLLPITQQFDEYRYILSRNYLEACFAKEADFFASLAYLSFMESQKNRSLYAKIPCNLTTVTNVTSYTLLSLCLSFYSGTRPWQREVFVLPKCLSYRMLKDGVAKESAQEQESFIHFLFSSCSALEHFSASLFSESDSDLSKEQAFSLIKQIILYLDQLTNPSNVSQDLLTQIAKLSYFINYWQKIEPGTIISENVANPRAKKGIFDGIWWLDRELKNDFNLLGKQRFLKIVSTLKQFIEAQSSHLK